MRDLRTIVRNVLTETRARQDRAALIDAHTAAEKWHYEMGRALRLEREIEEHRAEHGVASLNLAREYREAVRGASEAMNKMPVKWLSVFDGRVGAPHQVAAE